MTNHDPNQQQQPQQQQPQQQPPPQQQQQYQQQQPPQQQQQYQQQPGEAVTYSPEEIEQSKVVSALAYLGILFFLPLVVTPVTRYGKFHANQGLLLLLTSVAGGIIIAILSAIFFAISWRLIFLGSLLYAVFYIGIVVLVILGIVNALGGKAKPLPVIGKMFTIIK